MPTLTTTSITAVATTSVRSGGTLVNNGGEAVTVWGVCWSTSTNPTIANNKTEDGSGTGSYTSLVTGLTGNTTYYLRAYAINSAGTGYGDELSFTTTSSVTDYDGNIYNTVQIGTQLWMQENLKVIHYRNGDAIPNVTDNTEWSNLISGAYCWYNNNEATYKVTYGALYNYHTTVNNLNLCPAGWHVPTDAEWTVLTTYLGGEDAAGSKLKETGTSHWATPNDDATNESAFTALPGGYRDGMGAFNEIGTYGVWASSSQYNDVTYYWERYIRNIGTYVYRDYMLKQNGFSVRCLQGEGQVLPAITTTAISGITATTATSGGNITSDGGASVTARGVCWSTTSKPTTTGSKTEDGSGTGNFVSNISGLSSNTTYYVRAYATNSVGTAYGNEVSFTTDPLTMSDIDGNVYFVVRIGTQLWMKENLKTTHYNDGSEIPLITDNTEWTNKGFGGAYCWYNNDETTYKGTYGAIYAWGTLGLVCPAGWHVPSASEWGILADLLGGSDVAGGKMKETGTVHWTSPNNGATNESGFTGLPGGQRGDDGTFGSIGTHGIWHSTTSHTYWYDCYYLRNTETALINSSSGFGEGLYVRCLKN